MNLFQRVRFPQLCSSVAIMAVLLVTRIQACAQDELADRFAARTFSAGDAGSLPYRLLTPLAIKDGETYPLVVFLHGAGERGDDNQAQLIHVVKELATDEMRARYPAFVIAPQCPRNGWWAGQRPRRLGSDSPPSVPLVLKLVDALQAEFPIDANRIYITGLSMGGYGTWGAIQERPDLFAAAAPICGGGDPQGVSGFAHLPIWVFHGDQDRAVPVERSREMVSALRQAGGNPIYTEYPGVEHNSWTQTAQNRLFWDWMFAQRRPTASPGK